MKYILTLILIITLFGAKAQTTNEPYFPQPDLKRFIGKWQCTSDDTTFTVNLALVKKHIKGSGDGIYMDLIEGDYIIAKGGQVLQSSSNFKGVKAGGYVNKDISKDRIEFLFTDIGKKSKRGQVVFEVLNGKDNEANWTLNNSEGVHIGYYDYSFSVPVKAVFKRVK